MRGVDLIDVTGTVRSIWHWHLSYWYPQLPQVTREWYANAEAINASLRTQWPLLNPVQRAFLLQQWSMELPQMLWMLEPVLAEARATGAQAQAAQAQAEPQATQGMGLRETLEGLAEMRRQMLATVEANTRRPEGSRSPQPSASQARQTSSADAIRELNRQMDNNVRLQNFATQMTASTINLMHAMNRH